MIARVLQNRERQAVVDALRAQAEMDELVSAAGY